MWHKRRNHQVRESFRNNRKAQLFRTLDIAAGIIWTSYQGRISYTFEEFNRQVSPTIGQATPGLGVELSVFIGTWRRQSNDELVLSKALKLLLKIKWLV